MDENNARQRFSVDIKGLLEALTEQFPEPLLCVRELIQNAADAGAQRIEVDTSYDAQRSMFRLAVRDDGRGMNTSEIEGYLTIGFSLKDATRDRGRFGVGKLSPYALSIARMVVESCDGDVAHRLTFNHDGSGTLARLVRRARGTVVRVYKRCTREEAEELSSRTFTLVEERCGSIHIPLFVNGHRVNRQMCLPTPYAVQFSSPDGDGVIGLCTEPSRCLMGGGIVLETGAPILGEDVSYVLDSPRLSPTLSRNAVRRDAAFDSLLRAAQGNLVALTEEVASQLRARVAKLQRQHVAVERGLDPIDRAALEWLRCQLLNQDDEAPCRAVREAPVLETADGGLVSADDLVRVIRREGRVPASRVPRTREEVSAYADRGVPVLLLYRDLEDFLERQGISTVEIDGATNGPEVEPAAWSLGEAALAHRPRLLERRTGSKIFGAAGAAAGALGLWFVLSTPAERPVATEVSFASTPEGPATIPHAHDFAIAPAQSTNEEAAPERGPATSVPPSDAPTHAAVAHASRPALRAVRIALTVIALVFALASTAVGSAVLYTSLAERRSRGRRWLRAEADTPLTIGDTRARKLDVLRRAVLHPIDFVVARGWSIRSSGARSLSTKGAITGYRELAPEQPIQSGVRLDLDRIQIGFVDLLSTVGEPHDGRVLLRRAHRVLLNRNHPTIAALIRIACSDARRARVLLENLLATDVDLARGTDPRQVEWDLLGRAERTLRLAKR